MIVKCNKCGHQDEESKFPHGHDFFQKPYVKGCPKCDNFQSPGDASMRMFGGKRPFEFVTDVPVTSPPKDNSSPELRKARLVRETLRQASEAS